LCHYVSIINTRKYNYLFFNDLYLHFYQKRAEIGSVFYSHLHLIMFHHLLTKNPEMVFVSIYYVLEGHGGFAGICQVCCISFLIPFRYRTLVLVIHNRDRVIFIVRIVVV
jgi:hypothetical protein